MIMGCFWLCVLVAVVYGGSSKVIFDTDMDVDDMHAIMFMLGSEYIDLKAITVAENGWSNQIAGVPNALKLVKKFGCDNVPVAYGSPGGLSVLNYDQNAELPEEDLLGGIDHFFDEECADGVEGVFIPESHVLPYPKSAELLMIDILKTYNDVIIFTGGPMTNLARAARLDPTIWSSIDKIVVSGGKFNYTNTVESQYPYSWKTKGASWNIFLDPIAFSEVLQQSSHNDVDLEFFLPLLKMD
eukprot:UN32553